MKNLIKFWMLLSVLFATTVQSTVLSPSVATLSASNSWCAAIRGNGQGIPAHWGAMAELMESYGAPSAMSGGSSASITQFLIESVLINPVAINAHEHAFLVKSFEGYLEFIGQTPEAQAIHTLLGSIDEITKFYHQFMLARATLEHVRRDQVEAYAKALHSFIQKQTEALEIIHQGQFKNILNPELINYVGQALKMGQQFLRAPHAPGAQLLAKQALYRMDQLAETIKVFGQFNSKTDSNLFFRHGLVSFKNLSLIIGDMANFYAGVGTRESWQQNLGQWLNSCAMASRGQTWQTFANQNPACRQQLFGLITQYRKSPPADRMSRLKDKVGQYMPTLVPTSLIAGASAQRFAKLQTQYFEQQDPQFGLQFKPRAEDVFFGNFGTQAQLQKIERRLKAAQGFSDGHGNRFNFSHDRKTELFKGLPGHNWYTALITSPAEPGLSALVPIDGSQALYSSGGWSDLHPTAVLKALGCSNVIYVTRKGGEGSYATGIAEKLNILQGFTWEQFNPQMNHYGLPEDRSSDWSRLYNLANPNSSFSVAIRAADGVWCTDWEASDLFRDGFHALVMRGVEGKLYLKPKVASRYLGQSELARLTQADNVFLLDQGYYQYAGCMPFELRP